MTPALYAKRCAVMSIAYPLSREEREAVASYIKILHLIHAAGLLLADHTLLFGRKKIEDHDTARRSGNPTTNVARSEAAWWH